MAFSDVFWWGDGAAVSDKIRMLFGGDVIVARLGREAWLQILNEGLGLFRVLRISRNQLRFEQFHFQYKTGDHRNWTLGGLLHI